MSQSKNHVVWFDIPAQNLERAMNFYKEVLAIEIHPYQGDPGMAMGVFSHEGPMVSGCIVVSEGHRPSEHGPLLYFNCEGRHEKAIAKVEKSGGKILKPRHTIGPHGFMAIVLDSEGNRIALHSHS